MTAKYSDGSTEDVTSDAQFDTSKVDMGKAGNYVIGISYKDQKTEISVRVIRMLSSIEVNKTATRYFTGDSLDLTDITVTARYSDGSTGNVTEHASIDASDVDMNQAGDYTIYVAYENETASIGISIVNQTKEPEKNTSTNTNTNTNVKLSRTKLTLAVKRTFSLKLENAPKGEKVTVKSTKPSVVSVKKTSGTKYKLTAKKAGSATINVKVGKKTYKCKIKVVKLYTKSQAKKIVKEYLNRHNLYVPTHIDIEGKKGNNLTIHGYDIVKDGADSGHAVTNFWYIFNLKTGKGKDQSTGKTIDYLN